MRERARRRGTLAGVVAGLVALCTAACGGIGSRGAGSASNGASGSSRGDLAYVVAFASPAQPGALLPRVALHPLRTLSPLKTTVAQPTAVALWHRDLVVIGQGDDQLVVLSPGGRVRERVVLGLQPDALVVQGHLALVAASGAGELQAVDLRTGRVLWSVAVGALPDAVAIAGRQALVADLGAGTVVPVDLVTHRAGPPIAVGPEPDALVVCGGWVLVSDFGADQAVALRLPHLSPGARIPLPLDPTGMVVAPGPGGGRLVWVVGGAALVPIHLPALVAGAPLRLPAVAEAVAVGRRGRHAWVAEEPGQVVAVDLASATVGRSTFVGGRPSAIVLGPGPGD